MGIASLYGLWLKPKNYPGVLVNRIPINVSTLSVDMNGIFHEGVKQVYDNLLDKNINPTDLELEIFAEIGRKIFSLVKRINPIDYLILAVDGVAPFAKMQQQRQRRYRAANESLPELFNRNAITPGTDFMNKLDLFLQKFIYENQNNLCSKILYSSHMVSGEGEHKIFAMMREKPEIYNPKANHVIYGKDADLIMLSMLSKVEDIYILREGFDDLINIRRLRDAIRQELNNRDITDFVLIMFLLGNDFLPRSPSFPSPSMIDDLFEIYRQLSLKLTTEGMINWQNLTKFFDLLAKKEEKILASLPETKFPSRMMQLATKTGKFDYEEFRSAWYSNTLLPKREDLLNIKIEINQSDLNMMISAYLEGMAWVMNYYHQGTFGINHLYTYNYFHSPLFFDLSEYMKDNSTFLIYYDKKVENRESKELDTEDGEMAKIKRFQSRDRYFGDNLEIEEMKSTKLDFYPLSRYPSILHQLLAVLPPGSESLVPYEIKELFPRKDFLSLLEDIFPFKFLIEADGVNKEHEAIAIVPPVDPKIIYQVINKIRIGQERQKLLFNKRETIFFEQSKSMIRNNYMKMRINKLIAENRNQRFRFGK